LRQMASINYSDPFDFRVRHFQERVSTVCEDMILTCTTFRRIGGAIDSSFDKAQSDWRQKFGLSQSSPHEQQCSKVPCIVETVEHD